MYAHWNSRLSLHPQRILILFLGIMAVLGLALAWLAWRVFEQDRSLDKQRGQERLDQASENISAALQRWPANIDGFQHFTADTATISPPEGLVVMRIHGGRVKVFPSKSLLFHPEVPTEEEASPALFAAGETLEHLRNQPDKAAEAYRALTQSSLPGVRAGALLRLGRALRKTGRNQEALDIYTDLGKLSSAWLMGLPAALVALDARCSVLESLHGKEALEQEAALLHSSLVDGDWMLLRSAWEYYYEESVRWGSRRDLTENQQQALLFSKAAEWIHKEWGAGRESPARRMMVFDGQPVVVSWTATLQQLDAVMAGSGYLAGAWDRILREQHVQGVLLDSDGRALIGRPVGEEQQAVRSLVLAGFPVTLSLSSADPEADRNVRLQRQRLLLSGFGILLLVLLAGSFFIHRSISHELAVSRLQSDFVSAVSHEFRTPLTSLRQLSEMLSLGRIERAEQRQQSYDILLRESERLHRLVESLLNFGRMEARAFRYRFESLDPSAFLSEVVAEFQGDAPGREYHVEWSPNGSLPKIRADRSALGLALWNLLDNAVKYSPECKTVWVDVVCRRDRLEISLRDRGMGIPIPEQKRIFHKFFRGSAANAGNIKGTGIGLAIVRHTVLAHGGKIRVESRPGCGSTFTIDLPLEKTP